MHENQQTCLSAMPRHSVPTRKRPRRAFRLLSAVKDPTLPYFKNYTILILLAKIKANKAIYFTYFKTSFLNKDLEEISKG
ncbi:uncharacterized protein TRIREDRAFT_111012 [Trichoderma reesei QM6a]|uniref:Predicted protein n=1 Tax=Hypocrea jecorina (strain QM6a) TaxID=431241 RepID=G0RTJ3_HYPJQ|nr:uncharacterized protein TRIREDRAFT_111012 [Trichoderma reesei QM6a]EGR45576.1 predicted protein [Trichoderma reesei QM6a]